MWSKDDKRNGDLFILSWDRVWRCALVSVASDVLIEGACITVNLHGVQVCSDCGSVYTCHVLFDVCKCDVLWYNYVLYMCSYWIPAELLIHCLLNTHAICLGMVAVLWLNVMVLSCVFPWYMCFVWGPTVCSGVPSWYLFWVLYDRSYFRVHFWTFGIVFIFGATSVSSVNFRQSAFL